jgi:hypothetical protein
MNVFPLRTDEPAHIKENQRGYQLANRNLSHNLFADFIGSIGQMMRFGSNSKRTLLIEMLAFVYQSPASIQAVQNVDFVSIQKHQKRQFLKLALINSNEHLSFKTNQTSQIKYHAIGLTGKN